MDQQAIVDHVNVGGRATLFEQEAEEVLDRLRTAASRLVAAAPAPVPRATDLQHILGVRATLAWQVFRLATATDPFGAVPHIPQSESMASALRAARSRGFRSQVVDEVVTAYAAFEKLVKDQAGDRGTFDAMVAALGREASDQIALKHRRAAFRASAQLWGFKANTLYRCVIHHTSPAPGRIDAVGIRGWLGLRALRYLPSLPLTHRAMVVERDHRVSVTPSDIDRPWVLDEYCSQPLPTIESVREGDAWTEMLHLVGVGRATRVDCFLAATARGVSYNPNESGGGVLVNVPSEELILDVLIPRGISVPRSLCSLTYGCAHLVENAITREDRYRMPDQQKAVYLGTSIDALHDPRVPRCPEMLRHVLRTLEWQKTVFDVYRCRSRFPIMHTAIMLKLDGASDAPVG